MVGEPIGKYHRVISPYDMVLRQRHKLKHIVRSNTRGFTSTQRLFGPKPTLDVECIQVIALEVMRFQDILISLEKIKNKQSWPAAAINIALSEIFSTTESNNVITLLSTPLCQSKLLFLVSFVD